LQDVVQLLRSGVEDKVVLHYIGTSEDPFEVGSEAIIYLTDLGASGEIINAMMERDEQLRSGRMGSSSEPRAGEPWPPAGTVAEVPASGDASASGEETAAADTSAVPAEAADTVSIDYFHAYLAPYGTWVQVQGYGLCWQPTVAVSCAGWMPYGDRGRWVYTDHGWYWYSDYTWGWATFHYGRWFHHSRWGWCWVPGTVWGPSWVAVAALLQQRILFQCGDLLGDSVLVLQLCALLPYLRQPSPPILHFLHGGAPHSPAVHPPQSLHGGSEPHD